MPDPKKSNEQTLEVILKNSGLPIHRVPEWRKIVSDNNFGADFFVLNKNILISRPSGYSTLLAIEQSIKLNKKVRHQGIPKGVPYIQIEDFSQLQGAALETRKYYINYFQNRKNLLAVIFCNTSALFKLSINLGKRIYPFKFNIHIANDLPEAIQLAKTILSNKDLLPENNALPLHKTKSPDIVDKKKWSLNLDEYKMRFELIDDDILHPVPSGFLREEHIEPIFKLQKKVFSEMNLKDGEYYLLSDLKVLKGTTFKARRLFEKALKKWNHEHPVPMLIFYNANWILRAAINLARVVASYNVRIADNFTSAIAIITEDRSRRLKADSANEFDTQHNPKDQNQKYVDEIISILASINWEKQDPEAITKKIDPSHPFRPVAEAISLVKMDIDQLLQERDDSAKALLKSREKYKNILDNIEEGYYEVDLSGKIVFSNPSLCRILGYPAAKLHGMSFRGFCAKDYIDPIFKTFNQVYRTGQPDHGFNWKLIQEDGAERIIETSISTIQNDNGKTIGFKGIVRDITPRIQLEREKEKLEARLRHAHKMEAIGTLAGGVAHDLNNILSGLVSYPDLLLLKLPPESPFRKPIRTIKKSGEKAAAIVQDLLTLARKGLPDLSIVNLNTLIEEYLKSPEHSALLINHPLVTVISNLDKKLINTSASGVHISKILMNLTNNAAEAMSDGGTIGILTQNLYIDTPLPGYKDIKEGEYIQLQVSDNGIGMSPEETERIFEPFYTRKKMGRSGSGLGMAMVWGAVHDHNGYIEVSSIPGQKTTISIYLPAVRSDISADSSSIPTEILSGKNENILIIDDLAEQRELAAQMLTQLGYTTASVASGEKAVEYIKNNPADLLIIDMIMDPGMDGLDTYKKIIAIKPYQKAIIATGYSTSERIRQVQALGAGACLKKPYLIEDLARNVREALLNHDAKIQI